MGQLVFTLYPFHTLFSTLLLNSIYNSVKYNYHNNLHSIGCFHNQISYKTRCFHIFALPQHYEYISFYPFQSGWLKQTHLAVKLCFTE